MAPRTAALIAWEKVVRFTDVNRARLEEVERSHVLERCPFVDAVTLRSNVAERSRLDLAYRGVVLPAARWRDEDDWDLPYDVTVYRGSYLNGDYEPVENARHGEMSWR